MRNSNRSLLIPLLVFFVSVVVIAFLMPKVDVSANFPADFHKNDFLLKAESIANLYNLSSARNPVDAKPVVNDYVLRTLQSQIGIQETNELVRKGLPIPTHQFQFLGGDEPAIESDAIVISSDSDTSRNQPNPEANTDSTRKPNVRITTSTDNSKVLFRVDLDNYGRVVSLAWEGEDSTANKKTPIDSTAKYVLAFLSQYSAFSVSLPDTGKPAILSGNFEFSGKCRLNNPSFPYLTLAKIDSVIQNGKTELTFRFTGYDSAIDDTLRLEVKTDNSLIRTVSYSYAGKNASWDEPEWLAPILVLGFGFFMLILTGKLGFARFRAYEIGFRSALMWGTLAAVSMALMLILVLKPSVHFSDFIGVIVSTLFIGAAMTVLWSVGEAEAREQNKKRFLELDLIMRGYFSHSAIGQGIIRGIGFGFGLLAFFLVLLWLVTGVLGLKGITYSPGKEMLQASVPIFYSFFSSLLFSLFQTASFSLLLLPYLRRKIQHSTLPVVITALAAGAFVSAGVSPFYVGNLFFALVMLPALILINRTNFLTGMIMFLVFYGFLHIWSPIFHLASEQTIVLFGVMSFAVIGYSLFTIFSKNPAVNIEALAPEYARRITERERLQKEMTFAREVQFSFLPKKNPNHSKLDIAAKCNPASEVGGDYYDFLHLGQNRLGIIIGDVAGKGTKAAFHMTLIKGFLKAVAKRTHSPLDIIRDVNELYVENTEPGNFVTMLLAVVDLELNQVRFARAGHLPVLFKRAGKIQKILPAGVAVGMEKGDKFFITLKEEVLDLKPGDEFLFITDGLTEALNKKGEEFGLEKIIELFANQESASSAERLESVFGSIETFAKGALQHDDMTMVVIRSLE